MVSKKLDLELNGDGVAGLFDSLDEERVAAGRGVEALQPGLGVPATTGLQAGRFADVVPWARQTLEPDGVALEKRDWSAINEGCSFLTNTPFSVLKKKLLTASKDKKLIQQNNDSPERTTEDKEKIPSFHFEEREIFMTPL